MSKSIASKLILKNTKFSMLENCRNIKQLMQIHAQILKTDYLDDKISLSKLLEASVSVKSSSFNYSSSIFLQIENPNTYTWNTMINACTKIKASNHSILLYREMLRLGSKPNGLSFIYIARSCSDLENLQILTGLHSQIIKYGFRFNVVVLNVMIRAYCGCGCIDYARKVFDESPERDLISWTVVMNGYSKSKRAKEAIELFLLMENCGIPPDEIMAVSIFSACAQLGDLKLARRLETVLNRHGVRYNSYVSNSMIDMYSKCGSIHDARNVFDGISDKGVVSWNSMISAYVRSGNLKLAHELFDQMPQKNSVTWSVLINGYLKNDDPKKALLIFKEMRSNGIEANNSALTGAISACSRLGALDIGREIHSCLHEEKVYGDIILSTALVDMYAKCGHIETSRCVFDRIKKKSTVTWNVMIMGLAINGKAPDCLELFSKMGENGIKPDSFTFVGVLSSCSHSGLLEEGKILFHQMTEVYGIAPRIEHCSCLVHLMGRSGSFDQAVEFINSLPVKPDVAIWGALLNACRIHGNIEVGEYAANHMFELDPNHGGAYVLLSSMYAEAEMWKKVMEVRKKMKEMGIESRPGGSWIELGDKAHRFLIGDDLNPEITKMLSAYDQPPIC